MVAGGVLGGEGFWLGFKRKKWLGSRRLPCFVAELFVSL
jgi:hypothetical protein